MKNGKHISKLVCVLLAVCLTAFVAVAVSAAVPSNAKTVIGTGEKQTVNGMELTWPETNFTEDGATALTLNGDKNSSNEYVIHTEDISGDTATYDYRYMGQAPIVFANISANSTRGNRVILQYAYPDSYDTAGGTGTRYRTGNIYDSGRGELAFYYTTTYSANGDTNTVSIRFEDLDYFLSGQCGSSSAYENASESYVMMLTPVLKRLVACDDVTRVTTKDGTETNVGLEMKFEYVKTLDLVSKGNYYYTDFSYQDGELDAGIYNISFVLTYKDAYGNLIALDIDGSVGDIYKNGTTQIDTDICARNCEFMDGDESQSEKDVYVRHITNALSHLNGACESVYDMGLTSIIIVSSDDAKANTNQDTYEVDDFTYEYGTFDPELIEYSLKGEDTTSHLFDTFVDKDGSLTSDAIFFRLYRVYSDGSKQVVEDVGDNTVTANDVFWNNYSILGGLNAGTYFYWSDIFNDLNVGTYEIEVVFNGVNDDNGVRDYISFAKGSFTVTPKTVNEDSKDIYVLLAEYADDGKLTDGIYEQNLATLQDALAYYAAYQKADDADALYAELKAEYDKVAGAYATAYREYHELISVFADDLGRYRWVTTLETDEQAYYEPARKQDLLTAYAATFIKGDALETENPVLGSYLDNAYQSYVAYIDAYEAYVTFCKGKGIEIASIANQKTEFGKYYNKFLDNKDDYFVWNAKTNWSNVSKAYLGSWGVTDDILEANESFFVPEPEMPGGLCAPVQMEKTYNGIGQYPGLILAHYVENTTLCVSLRPMHSLEVLTATEGEDKAYYGYYVIRMPESSDELYDYGDKDYAYIAYTVTVDGKDVTETAIHTGNYPFTVNLEGNYKGSVSGFDFTINKRELTIDETTESIEKTYDQKAFDPLTDIGSLTDFDTRYYLSESYALIIKGRIDVDHYGTIIDTPGNSPYYYDFYKSFRGRFNMVIPLTGLQCKIEKDDGKGNFTKVDNATDVGTYRLTYSLSADAAKDFALINSDGEEVTSIAVTLTVEPESLTVNYNIAGVEHGDTLADVLKKITYKTVNGAEGDFSLITSDEANAKLYDDGEALEADAKLEAGKTYQLYIPVSLKDSVNYSLDNVTTLEETTYVVVDFTVDKKTVTVDWSESAFSGKYDGESHMDKLKAFFIDVNGEKQYLTVVSDVEPTHAGTYEINVVLPEELSASYRLPTHTEKTYEVLPLEITPSVVDNTTYKDIVYNNLDGENRVITFLYNKYTGLKFNGALADDVDMAVTADGASEEAVFSYEMSVVALTVNGERHLFAIEDYDEIPAGTYDVVFTLTCKTLDYVLLSDEVVAKLVVTPRDLTEDALVYPEDAQFTYDGKEHELKVEVYDSILSKQLREERDFYLTYENNIHAGTAKVIVTFVGNYKGEWSTNFTINKKNITLTEANGHPEDVIYDGTEQKPTFTIVSDEFTLTENDYTVTYSDNIDVGTAKAHIVATTTGDFTFDAYDVTFKVTPKDLSELGTVTVENLPYTGSAVTPVPVVKYGDDTLVEGTDYTVSYVNNINVGTATVIITYMGNYTGVTKQNFTVKSLVIESDEKSGDSEEKQEPQIIIEFEGGFEDDIVIKVEVVVSTQMKDKDVSDALLIDYKEQLGRKESISQIYDVKLMQVDENGNETEINVSDLKDGATIVVKMAIPDDIKAGGKLIRVLHVHAADDISTLAEAPAGTTVAELKVGEFIIDGDYLITRIDRLSEFAFVCEKDCFYHWILLGELFVFLAWFVLKKRKNKWALIIPCVVFVATVITAVILGYCKACLILAIICALALIAVIVFFLLSKRKPKQKPIQPGKTAKPIQTPANESAVAEKAAEKAEKPKKLNEEEQLQKTYEQLATSNPAPENFDGEGKVEVVGVCLAGRKKIYRFSPVGVQFAQGDKVSADTVNGMIHGIVVHANYFANPQDLATSLKNVTPENDAE